MTSAEFNVPKVKLTDFVASGIISLPVYTHV